MHVALTPSSPIGAVLLVVGALTALYLVARVVRASGSRPIDFLTEFAAHVVRVAAIGAGITLIMLVPAFLRAQGNVAGMLGSTLTILVSGIVITVATLFLIRQFIAPPWWRLNSWNTSTSVEYTGSFSDIGTLIIRDSIASLMSISIVDRVVVLVGIPALLADLSMVFGMRTVLQGALTVLLVMYISLVVALLAANRIPRILMSRLVELRSVARRIRQGDLSARVSVRELGEYEELSDLVIDINGMARALEERQDENALLQHRLRSTLEHEQEVATRDGLTQLRNRRYFEQSLQSEIDRCTHTGSAFSIAILDLDNFKQVNDKFGHAEGDAVLQRMAATLNGMLRPYDLPARLGGEEFGVIFPETPPHEAAMLLQQLMDALHNAGAQGARLTFSGGVAAFPAHGQDVETLYLHADEAAYDAKLKGKARVRLYDAHSVVAMDSVVRKAEKARADAVASARALIATLDSKESGDAGHSERVGRFAAAMAQAMGAPEAFCTQMQVAGVLHDIGKLGLDEASFNTAEPLTDAQFEQIKRHPELGAQMVVNAGLGEVAAFVMYHHESWDGTGYPHQLAGDEIPIGARIIAVAEAFETMTSDRKYRGRMEPDVALAELRSSAGSRFDPRIVEVVAYLLAHGMMPDFARIVVDAHPEQKAA